MDLTRSLEWVGEIPVAFALKVQQSKWYSMIMPMRWRKKYVFALNFLNYISFKLYEKTRRILETYQTQPFRHYQKLSTIMDNSRATGRFTHRGTMRPSDIENESDHSASTDNLGNQTSLSKQLPSESLTLSWHGSTSSSGRPPTSLATPHSIFICHHFPSLPRRFIHLYHHHRRHSHEAIPSLLPKCMYHQHQILICLNEMAKFANLFLVLLQPLDLSLHQSIFQKVKKTTLRLFINLLSIPHPWHHLHLNSLPLKIKLAIQFNKRHLSTSQHHKFLPHRRLDHHLANGNTLMQPLIVVLRSEPPSVKTHLVYLRRLWV